MFAVGFKNSLPRTSGDCHRSPQQIAKLYAAEKDIRCRGSDERRAVG
jgi:hypothetical protein